MSVPIPGCIKYTFTLMVNIRTFYKDAGRNERMIKDKNIKFYIATTIHMYVHKYLYTAILSVKVEKKSFKLYRLANAEERERVDKNITY